MVGNAFWNVGLTVLLSTQPLGAQDRLDGMAHRGDYPSLHPSQATHHNPSSGPVCFYGGDFAGRAALNSQRNTLVDESWTFDDVQWPGGRASVAWANFLLFEGAVTPVAGDIAIYQGMGEGRWGTQIIEIWDITDGLSWKPTGRIGFGRVEYELRFNVDFALAPGGYHVGIRLVGTGSGEAFITVSNGGSAQGEPIGNGNSFFQSYFFGFPVPTDWQNLKGAGLWDVSIGLCGDAGVALALDGECPGVMTARVSGATPGGRVALIHSAPGRCGGQTTIPPPNPCSGAVLPLGGASLVGIITADGQGNAAVTGNVPGAVCGRVCLLALDLPTCEVSNVVEF